MNKSFGTFWEHESQNKRFLKCKRHLDFIKVNAPITSFEKVKELNFPILLHNGFNSVSSKDGNNENVLKVVNEQANSLNSSYICESLGVYKHSLIFSNIYDKNFYKISLQNIKAAKEIYQRPMAITLGPHYQVIKNDFEDEIDFLIKLSVETDSKIVLDLTSLMATNYNLNRPLDYGVERLLQVNVVEVELSGIQVGSNGRFWHKSTLATPSRDSLYLLKDIYSSKSKIQNITWNQSFELSEKEYLNTFEIIHKMIR